MINIAAIWRAIEDDLVEIPHGQVVVGSTPELAAAVLDAEDLARTVDPSWLTKEIPRHIADVAGFGIARRPLTIEQVRALASETAVQPTLAGAPDHPATVGADATFVLTDALSQLFGHHIRVATEYEWVRAARGDDDRIYPWGDHWDSTRANIDSGSSGGISPVGAYPAGRSAFGLLDMAGNADELTCTPYAPFPGAPETVPEQESWARSPYITKGGGWMHRRDVARCDRRHGIYGSGEPLAVRLVVTET